MSDASWQQHAGCGFRHECQIDKRRRQLRAFGQINEITMQEHGCANAYGEPRDCRNDRLVGTAQRLDEVMGCKIGLSRRSTSKICKIISRGECVALSCKQHDTNCWV